MYAAKRAVRLGTEDYICQADESFHVAQVHCSQSVIGMMDGWTEEDWKDVLKDVYQHARGVKYLDVLTEDEIEEIKDGAKHYWQWKCRKWNEVTT